MGKFTFTQTEIPGVVVIEPQVFGDDRGYFMETYQKDQFAEAGIDKEFVPPAVCCAACTSRRTTRRASWCA